MERTTRYRGRYVFVAGLHRTGTSLVARILASHPEVAAITNSPAPENEGCYLQGAIPHTAQHGIPGHYATDPAQHLIEGCAFDNLETRLRIENDWDRWFGPGDSWRVEKSPVNLTRTRLYQQLFPTAQFVVVVRHPAVMAAALGKWLDAEPSDLVDYALDALDTLLDDLEHLHAAFVFRYEDLACVDRSGALWAFLGVPPAIHDITIRDGNADYPKTVPLSPEQARRAARFGYGDNGTCEAFTPIVRHPLRAVRDAVTDALKA